jgi:hypothetical protein
MLKIRSWFAVEENKVDCCKTSGTIVSEGVVCVLVCVITKCNTTLLPDFCSADAAAALQSNGKERIPTAGI